MSPRRGKQLLLFDKPRLPRARPRVMMHVVDAGEADVEDFGPYLARFKCRRCDHETDWESFKTITEIKRGQPCPNCNPTEGDQS